MEALFNSFALVFISEMGDKTQLLSLLLVARYKKPWTILAGVLVATLLNHAFASWAGAYVAAMVAPEVLRWSLAILFFGFGLWILIPDKETEVRGGERFGVFMTTAMAFFMAEMGDKTQLATVALGAQYANTALVTLGTTLGMLASNALAVFLGEKFLTRVPLKWVRIGACVLFIAFGLGILLSKPTL